MHLSQSFSIPHDGGGPLVVAHTHKERIFTCRQAGFSVDIQMSPARSNEPTVNLERMVQMKLLAPELSTMERFNTWLYKELDFPDPDKHVSVVYFPQFGEH